MFWKNKEIFKIKVCPEAMPYLYKNPDVESNILYYCKTSKILWVYIKFQKQNRKRIYYLKEEFRMYSSFWIKNTWFSFDKIFWKILLLFFVVFFHFFPNPLCHLMSPFGRSPSPSKWVTSFKDGPISKKTKNISNLFIRVLCSVLCTNKVFLCSYIYIIYHWIF